MKIYVMRHGITAWNEKGITQGRTNNRLSKAGIEQAKEQAEKFKNINFDLIFTSPLMRAKQTANIMNKFHNVKKIVDERLTEVNQGKFTGKKYESLSENDKNLKHQLFINSAKSRYQNMQKFLNFIKENYNNKTILIVTHSINASFIDKILKNEKLELENLKIYNFENAEIKEYNF